MVEKIVLIILGFSIAGFLYEVGELKKIRLAVERFTNAFIKEVEKK